MGTYLNPGNELIQRCLASKIYVDKTMLIAEMNRMANTNRKHVCVSRPRRFGKSMAGNMLAAYYSKGCDSRALFEGLKIAKDASFEQYLNKLNVVKFDLNAFLNNNIKKTIEVIDNIERAIIKEFAKQYPTIEFEEDGCLADAIRDVYAETGEQFVIIIDEYDVIVREHEMLAKQGIAEQLLERYLAFLNGLFKNADLEPAIALAYITGILPVVRSKTQSGLNLFTEYTMLEAGALAEYVGFTPEETLSLCKEYGLDYEECKRWYDGYTLDGGRKVFSPCSVVKAIREKRCGYNWTQTGSYKVIKHFIDCNFDGIKDKIVTMMGGGRIDVEVEGFLNTITDFETTDDAFTYLIHLGYLAYDNEKRQCYIPNREVRSQWVLSIKPNSRYTEIIKMIDNSKTLLDAVIEGDEGAVAAALEEAHGQVTSPLSYNNEQSMQSAIGLAFFYATSRYTIVKEMPAGKGYADMAFIPYVPNVPAMVVELKRNRGAETAMGQIKERRYEQALQKYKGEVLLVGISYDAESKKHTCKIERTTR